MSVYVLTLFLAGIFPSIIDARKLKVPDHGGSQVADGSFDGLHVNDGLGKNLKVDLLALRQLLQKTPPVTHDEYHGRQREFAKERGDLFTKKPKKTLDEILGPNRVGLNFAGIETEAWLFAHALSPDILNAGSADAHFLAEFATVLLVFRNGEAFDDSSIGDFRNAREYDASVFPDISNDVGEQMGISNQAQMYMCPLYITLISLRLKRAMQQNKAAVEQGFALLSRYEKLFLMDPKMVKESEAAAYLRAEVAGDVGNATIIPYGNAMRDETVGTTADKLDSNSKIHRDSSKFGGASIFNYVSPVEDVITWRKKEWDHMYSRVDVEFPGSMLFLDEDYKNIRQRRKSLKNTMDTLKRDLTNLFLQIEPADPRKTLREILKKDYPNLEGTNHLRSVESWKIRDQMSEPSESGVLKSDFVQISETVDGLERIHNYTSISFEYLDYFHKAGEIRETIKNLRQIVLILSTLVEVILPICAAGEYIDERDALFGSDVLEHGNFVSGNEVRLGSPVAENTLQPLVQQVLRFAAEFGFRKTERLAKKYFDDLSKKLVPKLVSAITASGASVGMNDSPSHGAQKTTPNRELTSDEEEDAFQADNDSETDAVSVKRMQNQVESISSTVVNQLFSDSWRTMFADLFHDPWLEKNEIGEVRGEFDGVLTRTYLDSLNLTLPRQHFSVETIDESELHDAFLNPVTMKEELESFIDDHSKSTDLQTFIFDVLLQPRLLALKKYAESQTYRFLLRFFHPELTSLVALNGVRDLDGQTLVSTLLFMFLMNRYGIPLPGITANEEDDSIPGNHGVNTDRWKRKYWEAMLSTTNLIASLPNSDAGALTNSLVKALRLQESLLTRPTFDLIAGMLRRGAFKQVYKLMLYSTVEAGQPSIRFAMRLMDAGEMTQTGYNTPAISYAVATDQERALQEETLKVTSYFFEHAALIAEGRMIYAAPRSDIRNISLVSTAASSRILTECWTKTLTEAEIAYQAKTAHQSEGHQSGGGSSVFDHEEKLKFLWWKDFWDVLAREYRVGRNEDPAIVALDRVWYSRRDVASIRKRLWGDQKKRLYGLDQKPLRGSKISRDELVERDYLRAFSECCIGDNRSQLLFWSGVLWDAIEEQSDRLLRHYWEIGKPIVEGILPSKIAIQTNSIPLDKEGKVNWTEVLELLLGKNVEAKINRIRNGVTRGDSLNHSETALDRKSDRNSLISRIFSLYKTNIYDVENYLRDPVYMGQMRRDRLYHFKKFYTYPRIANDILLWVQGNVLQGDTLRKDVSFLTQSHELVIREGDGKPLIDGQAMGNPNASEFQWAVPEGNAKNEASSEEVEACVKRMPVARGSDGFSVDVKLLNYEDNSEENWTKSRRSKAWYAVPKTTSAVSRERLSALNLYVKACGRDIPCADSGVVELHRVSHVKSVSGQELKKLAGLRCSSTQDNLISVKDSLVSDLVSSSARLVDTWGWTDKAFVRGLSSLMTDARDLSNSGYSPQVLQYYHSITIFVKFFGRTQFCPQTHGMNPFRFSCVKHDELIKKYIVNEVGHLRAFEFQTELGSVSEYDHLYPVAEKSLDKEYSDEKEQYDADARKISKMNLLVHTSVNYRNFLKRNLDFVKRYNGKVAEEEMPKKDNSDPQLLKLQKVTKIVRRAGENSITANLLAFERHGKNSDAAVDVSTIITAQNMQTHRDTAGNSTFLYISDTVGHKMFRFNEASKIYEQPGRFLLTLQTYLEEARKSDANMAIWKKESKLTPNLLIEEEYFQLRTSVRAIADRLAFCNQHDTAEEGCHFRFAEWGSGSAPWGVRAARLWSYHHAKFLRKKKRKSTSRKSCTIKLVEPFDPGLTLQGVHLNKLWNSDCEIHLSDRLFAQKDYMKNLRSSDTRMGVSSEVAEMQLFDHSIDAFPFEDELMDRFRSIEIEFSDQDLKEMESNGKNMEGHDEYPLKPYEYIDLIDMDVQGLEYLIVVRDYLPLFAKFVKRVHIGTHSRSWQAKLKRMFLWNGFVVEQDFLAMSMLNYEQWGAVGFRDGILSFINKRFI